MFNFVNIIGLFDDTTKFVISKQGEKNQVFTCITCFFRKGSWSGNEGTQRHNKREKKRVESKRIL